MSMKNSSDTIGNRTRDLPACSAVPQPTAPPRAPYNTVWCNNQEKYHWTTTAVAPWNPLDIRESVHRDTTMKVTNKMHFFFLWRCDPTRVMASSFLMFLDHTQRRTTLGRTPLDKWSARRRDLYLTVHNTHNRQISMPSVGFELTISAGERPLTYTLDRAATGTSNKMHYID